MTEPLLEQPAPVVTAKKTERMIAGIRLSALLEVAFFIAVMLAADRIFFDGTRFRSLALHPLWLPVVLVSVQYGTNAGIAAAIASTAALLAWNLPPHSILQDRFGWWFEVAKTPLMWFVAAVALGELRVRHMRSQEAVEEQLEDALRRERIMTEAYTRANGIKEALEARLVSQTKTAIGLCESVRAIEKLDPAGVLMGVSGLVRAVVNPDQFSVYLLQNGRLEMAVTEGWSAETAAGHHQDTKSYGPDTDLFRSIVSHQHLLSVANPEDAAVLRSEGVVAVPIVVPDTGTTIGMLKIERLGFFDLTFTNLQTLKVICRWIGSSYDHALRYEAVRAESIVNTETELLGYRFLSRQLSFLKALASRVGFDLTMVVARLRNTEDMSADQLTEAPRIFSRVAAKALRTTDLAFDYERTGSEFAVILPVCAEAQAEIVVTKMQKALADEIAAGAPEADFSFTIQTVHSTSDAERTRRESLMQLSSAVSNSEVPANV